MSKISRLFLFALTIAGAAFPSTQYVLGQSNGLRWQTRRLTEKFYAEGATVGDFNQDGKPDVAIGPFWYEGPDFEKSHRLYHQDAFDPLGYSNNFLTFTGDFNGDGWDDILIAGWPGKEAYWHENPKGTDRYWPRHVAIEVCENESPAFTDITGDGKPELVCSSAGYFGFAEYDTTNPAAAWKFRRISDKSAGGRYTHGLGVGDVNNDGKMDLLEKSGWWEQPASLDDDPVWKKHKIAFGDATGPSQIFAYDVDEDGDNDVVCSRNAHGMGLAWFEQKNSNKGEAEFTAHEIMGDSPDAHSHGVCFSQLHALQLVDVNNDGLKDIVTGKRFWAHGPKGDVNPGDPAVVYWFELSRKDNKVTWTPHLIHDDSGVGTQVTTADLNGDKRLDVIVGNKKGAFVSLSSGS